MAIAQQSRTDRFILKFDDQIVQAAQLAQALAATIESDFARLRRYLPFDEGASPDVFQRYLTSVIFVDVTSKDALGLDATGAMQIPGRGGGRNFARGPGHGGTIWLNAFGATNAPLTPNFARFLFIAEMAEQLMGAYGWIASDCRGEALSRTLAELFQPDAPYQPECISVAPWVNEWMNSSPRFDYVNTTPVPTATNKLLGTDTDQLGYGCGQLFINYLRFQLGYPLEAICISGGASFGDTYKALTGRTDDPFVAMNALITEHYGGSFINLLDNNPFPLLASGSRSVSLGSSRSAREVPIRERVTQHIAHVSPFVTCAAKDYRYRVHAKAVTWTITATAEGFALPQFSWKLDGRPLATSSGTIDLPVRFVVPDPQDPRTPRSASGTARFEWTSFTRFARGALETTLTVTNDSIDGIYTIGCSVEVSERVSAGAPASANGSLEFDATAIVYEPSYYADLAECIRRFEHAVPSLQQTVDLVRSRPDPADPRSLSAVIRGVDDVRAQIGALNRNDPALVADAVAYVADRLGVEPNLFREPAGAIR